MVKRAVTYKFGRVFSILVLTCIAGTSIGAVPASAASITLSWTAPGDDGNVGTATTYDVRYSTSPITNANWNSATQATGEPTPSAAGTAESFTITGLNANTTYYFAIKTADETPNWSTISNIATATTSDTVAPSAIADLSARP
jgi:hypothetical protein